MNKSLLTCITTMALLTACSNDELVSIKSNDLNAITFNTFVNKSTQVSRATDITNANIGDFANGFSVYAYTNGNDAEGNPYATIDDVKWYRLLNDEHLTGSGTIETGDGSWTYSHTQYWKDGQLYHFHALAPYGDGATASDPAKNRHWTFTPQEDNLAYAKIHFVNIANSEAEKADGTQDLIYSYQTATGKAINNDEVKYTFSHLLSRVKFRFEGASTNPESVSIEVLGVTINDAYSEGDITLENQQASSKTLLDGYDWDVTGAEETTLSFRGTKSFCRDTAFTDHKYVIPVNEPKSYRATIQYQLTAKVNDQVNRVYKVTKDVELPIVTMRKGFSYIYVFSVKTGGTPGTNNMIEPIVFNVDVEEWDLDYESGEVKDPEELSYVGDFIDKTKAKLYDYVMSDGSFVRSSNELTEAQKAACVGVVYKQFSSNDEIDDQALIDAGHTHGLIMALNDYYSDSFTFYVGSNSKTYTNGKVSWQYNYCVVSTKTDSNDLLNQEKALGYSNTLVYKTFNETNENFKVLPVYLLADNFKDIANTSGWYIPSYKDYENISVEDLNSLNSVLAGLTDSAGAKKIGSEFTSLWTGTESSKTDTDGNIVGESGYQYQVLFTTGDDGTIKAIKLATKGKINGDVRTSFRPICAY